MAKSDDEVFMGKGFAINSIIHFYNYLQFYYQAQLPDDGSGALRVWRVRSENESGSPLVEVERPQAAAFYDGDCYIVLYTYHAPTGDQTVLYYWMVRFNHEFN